MPDYSKGKIYKIVNTKNDKIYIGSTTLALPDRMKGHRYHAKTDRTKFYKAMRRHGITNFSIVLIKCVSCVNKSELENLENKIANKLKLQGVKLYNMRFDGKHAEKSKAKMTGDGNGNFGKRGKDSGNFTRGCVTFLRTSHTWSFQWQNNDKRYTKSFSAKKYGYDEAKRLAEEYRDKIYPID